MTSRERIIETLNHREPDQLAIDFGAMRSTGIHAIAYHNLVRHLGMDLEPARLYDLFQQLAEPQPEVLQRFGGDVVQAHQRCPAFGISIAEGWKPIALPDGTPVMAPDGYNPVIEEDGSAYIYVNGVKWARKPSASL
jgi:uroporphyrinogen decarboxylase